MNRQDRHDEIDRIFRQLLTAQGKTVRPEQITLSHRMLEAMLNNGIALCDAGTGVGKTYAYLVAGIVFLRHRYITSQYFQPIIVSTSSIALQKAVWGEYLPLISRALLPDGMIHQPIQSVIRKGKHHYVCEVRLERRLRNIHESKKNPAAVQALRMLLTELDTNEVHGLSEYDREQVCVPPICDCKRKQCRYRTFLENCRSKRYLFQICNHNLLLADAIRRGDGQKPILPDSCAIIIDEAHKLPEAAREMFGVTLQAADIQNVILGLRNEKFLLAADGAVEPYARFLIGPDRVLTGIRKQIQKQLKPPTRRHIEDAAQAVSLFHSGSRDMIFLATENDQGGTMLCATTSDLTEQLRHTLWTQPRPLLLTSATIAVGKDFAPFRKENGLADDKRVTEYQTPSPFRYRENCLLYFPLSPPGKHTEAYYEQTAAEIWSLLDAAEGHALVLFTSYTSMSAVKEKLLLKPLRWPLFTMGGNPMYTVGQFKKKPGSVLLATGSAWEGFDFPGDCVSLLIIPQLPFPVPDAVREKKRENYARTSEFIHAVAVPEMQTKLMQGVGRSIRTETDTCVIAILDERSTPGQRYFQAVVKSLPAMPRTRSLSDVEAFIRRVKPGSYFSEGRQ